MTDKMCCRRDPHAFSPADSRRVCLLATAELPPAVLAAVEQAAPVLLAAARRWGHPRSPGAPASPAAEAASDTSPKPVASAGWPRPALPGKSPPGGVPGDG